VNVVPDSDAYGPIWHARVTDVADATQIVVEQAQSLDLDFALGPLEGAIAGLVMSIGGPLVGTVGAYSGGVLVAEGVLGVDGSFLLEGLAVGDYTVLAEADGWFAEWNADVAMHLGDEADPVSVVADSVTTVNFVLAALFSDVASGSQCSYEINWLRDTGITFGCGGGEFCGGDAVSRAQMGSFLARALGLVPIEGDVFDDVAGVHEPNINAIAAAGITSGCNAGGSRYCPSLQINRAQIATFLVRAMDYPPSLVDYFVDDEGSVHEPNINSLRLQEVTFGCGGDKYCPFKALTRAQMAALLYRALAGVLYPE
jgi:hypothetical protein